jgi:DNA polymerase-1
MNKYQELFKQLQKEKENSPSKVNDHIMIIDGLNTFIRAFSATPSTNEDGDHIGGITGFLYSIGKCVRDFKPTRLIIVFDGVGGSRRRRKINKDYKANRANKTRLRRHDHHFASMEQEQEAMRFQFSRLVSYLDCLPVSFLSMDGIEADDTIAYIVSMFDEDLLKPKEEQSKFTIVSTDRDFYQLIDNRIQIWSPIKKKMYTTETVLEEFGVHPVNYVMYRTFTGDKSDNIEGVKGIGPKTLLKHIPDLSLSLDYTPEDLRSEYTERLDESKTYQKMLDNSDIIEENWDLMNLNILDFPAQTKSAIRNIIETPIPMLKKHEFRKIFMEDKMWAVMKNLPEWLNNTWLSLSAFAQQTHKK